MEPIVVQGFLVTEPNKHFIRSVKLIIITYLAYYAYLFSKLLMNDENDYIDWAVAMLCAYIFTCWLPVYGLNAAKKNNERALSAFSCLQTFLCIWHLLQIVFVWSMLSMIINICDDCQNIFREGNKTCFSEFYQKTLEVTEDNCQKSIPNMDHIITTILQIGMALTSFMGTIYARKTKSMKVVSVISTDVPDIEESTIMAEPGIITTDPVNVTSESGTDTE